MELKEIQKIDAIEFEDVVVRERSISPIREVIGKCKNIMTLNKGQRSYFIEWYCPDNEEVYAEIGIWIKSGKVTDYDGVFCLPQQAKDLLVRNGFDISEVEDKNDPQKTNLNKNQ